jgi:hypothetical protein
MQKTFSTTSDCNKCPQIGGRQKEVSAEAGYTLVLFLRPAAVGGAREAAAPPAELGARATSVAVCDEDPPFAILQMVCKTRRMKSNTTLLPQQPHRTFQFLWMPQTIYTIECNRDAAKCVQSQLHLTHAPVAETQWRGVLVAPRIRYCC